MSKKSSTFAAEIGIVCPNMEQKQKKRRRSVASGLWIMIVAAVVLEAISCTMYFTSRTAIRHEAEQRARTELRKAELEISVHTIELETAAKALALMAEKHLDQPELIYDDTRLAVRSLRAHTSMAVAFIPDYYPKKGHFCEICSSRITEDSVFTRQIGSADHDYTQMEWWQNGFVHDSCWWCEPYLDNAGARTYVVSCSYPVCDKQGQVVAVVCIDMSLGDLKNLSDYLQVYPNSYYSIRSSTGMDIVPAPDTVAGRKYNIFHEEIDATGWHIEIIIPEEELFADLNHIGRIVGILMLLGLIVLALIVVYSTRTARKMVEFAEKNQRMEGELEAAQTIQMAMVPKVFPPFLDRLDLNIFGMVDPAKEVGGDLYDFYVRHDKLFFCVGDVSGKGIAAALVMATARSLFRSVTSKEENAATIVGLMNNALSEQNEQNMFLTLFLGVLDLETGHLEYCNAGHNAPVLITSRNSKAETLPVLPNLPMGIEKGYTFKGQTAELRYNDMLFLYTDGLNEAENPQHEQYGEERMMTLLAGQVASRPRIVVENMQASVAAFADGAPQSDDLTMLCIRYQKAAIVMRNDIQQIPTLSEWIDGLGVPDALNMPINLALEEAVSNVMLYAYPDKKNEQVFVEFVKMMDEDGQSEQLIFTISDSGIPFDPTQQKEADTTLSAEERPIGGLGIFLVNQLMDSVSYRREENKNILTLVKRVERLES